MKFFSLKILLVGAVLVAACTAAPPVKKVAEAPAPVVEKGPSDEEQLRRIADTTLRALHDKDYKRISELVHPVEGLTFSPYGYVNSEKTVQMTPEEVGIRFSSDTARRVLWGFFDGTGDSIKLTPKAYAQRFIYDRDFAGSDSMYFRKTPPRGNTLNNLEYAFPDGVVVESFVPGKKEMDWKALRMVFEKYNDRYYIVALVHDEWTI